MTDALPNFFVTGIAKALTGEQPCLLEPWFKARKLMPRREDGDAIVRWKIRHTELLDEEIARLTADGWRVQKEQYFRIKGQTAYLSGKPDIIAQKDGCRPLIVDVKGGKDDAYYAAQVGLYMVTIPMAWDRPTWIFDGAVVYEGNHRVPVSPVAAAALRPKAFALVKQLAGERPTASPGKQACRFCDATVAMCPEKYLGPDAYVETDLF